MLYQFEFFEQQRSNCNCYLIVMTSCVKNKSYFNHSTFHVRLLDAQGNDSVKSNFLMRHDELTR
jgi:hypothetical protein